MNIDKNRNLVIPIHRDNGEVLYVHSLPISREIFEAFHGVLSKAFSDLTNNGINIVACLSTARLALMDAAREMNALERVQAGLIGEIRRISTVIFIGTDGWDSIMMSDAIKRGILTEDEIDEVENALVFFILSMRLFLKAQRPIMIEAMTSLTGYVITSFSSMEYIGSLPTSTQGDSTKAAASSIVC